RKMSGSRRCNHGRLRRCGPSATIGKDRPEALMSYVITASQKLIARLVEPIIKSLKEEIRKSSTPYLELTGKNPLMAHGRRYFSQNDEDGILLEILRRLSITEPSSFCEFGVGNGTENNTIILLAMKWRGIWVGEEDLAFECPISGSRLAF